MKKYHKSPLPFQGQKCQFINVFKKELRINYDDNFVFVDLFGGSGLLSHTVKSIFPKTKVIYNDFDNFKKRLEAINETNSILSSIRLILKDFPRDKCITSKLRDSVLNVLKKADKKGFVDYITISSSLKFSMDYCTSLNDFLQGTLYNRVVKNNYSADKYLCGVDFVCLDYKELFKKYKNDKKVVFLVDPPYLSTDCSTYSSNRYWKLKNYLDLLLVLMNQNFFYFTSSKSQVVELYSWVNSVSGIVDPFENAKMVALNTSVTRNSQYTNIMYHSKMN